MARLLFILVVLVPILMFLSAIGVTVWLVVRAVLRRDARRGLGGPNVDS